MGRALQLAPESGRLESSVAASSPQGQGAFPLNEITIAELQSAYARKRFTSEQVVELYLDRISEIDRAGPNLLSILELNPDAQVIARELDAERAAGRVRGPLHGVPIVLKDVIDTADKMHTTAGSFALLGSKPPRDAFIVERLRSAGAIILGKANLSEWSNCRSTNGTSGWSARGGLTKNPYVLDRSACGSSSGTAVAVSANLVSAGIGVETDGSISCPASANGLVGVKPTVGLLSRSGLIPISFAQDTAGPVARTVTDAAILLGAMRGVDVRDLATDGSQGHLEVDYAGGLDAGALRGARIGVMRLHNEPQHPADPVFEGALAALRDAGATVVDNVDPPSIEDLQRAEVLVLLCEFKDLIREYLATRGPEEPHRSLADLIRFNVENADIEMRWFGQEWFEAAEATAGRRTPDYLPALTRCRTLSRTQGIDKAIADYRLDAIVTLAAGPAFAVDLLNGDHAMRTLTSLAAVAGYPRVTVPAGHVLGLPVGISFSGPAWSEGRLLSLAFAFEQHTKVRRPPRFLPTAGLDR
ncbi:MAG TPA: amidase [Gemmatimonadaceae bacterium]